MTGTLRRLSATLALVAAPVLAVPTAAQHEDHAGHLRAPTGLMADLLADVSEAEQKFMSLARAMPEASYAWAPAQGVRSVGGVFQHVAADNYLLPALLGVDPPAATGIKATSYATVQAYETRKIGRDEVIKDLEVSFGFLKKAMAATPADKLGEKVQFFGQERTRQQVWVLTVTHLHEHLGQAIAYARSNNVVPPWSRGG